MNNQKKAMEYFEQGLRVALDNGYVKTAVDAYSFLGNQYLGIENRERRLEYAQKGYELAKKVGAISAQSFLGNHLSGMYIGIGDINAALLLSEESVALNRKTNDLHYLALSFIALGRIYAIMGEWDRSEKILNEAVATAQKTNDTMAVALAWSHLGGLGMHREKYDKAREFGEKAYRLNEKAGNKIGQAGYLPLIIQASIDLGELEKAESQIDSLLQLAQEMKSQYHLALAYQKRAMLLHAQKRYDESIECFEKVLQEQEAFNSKKWDVVYFARFLLWAHARVYIDRNQEGDKQKAIDLLNQALEIFQKMHAKKDIEKVKAQITYLQTGRIVPLEPVHPVATGYPSLDKLLCGGVPPNFAVALTSPSCDERDLIIRSFLETGAKTGEATFYVTIDPSLAGFLPQENPSNFYLFVCNPQAEAIVKSAPNIFTLKGVENLTNISIALTSAIRKLDSVSKSPRRICISLVSDVLLQHGPVQTRKWLTELLTQLRSVGLTTLAVIDPQMHPSEQLHAILGLFEGEVNIREAETDKGLTRFLKIKRMSNQKYLKDEIPLTEE
jgi:tetratricopeptide (TPR) repeat protein/KaiC/GvpD/RAD55 family RecA-like ATPase